MQSTTQYYIAAAIIFAGLAFEHWRGPRKIHWSGSALWVTCIILWVPLLADEWITSIQTSKALPLSALTNFLISSTLFLSAALTATLVFSAHHLTRRYSKVWVKALDFPYMALAAVGLVRVINSSPFVTDRVPLLDTLGIFLIALAITIRLTKTIIEVFFDSWYNR